MIRAMVMPMAIWAEPRRLMRGLLSSGWSGVYWWSAVRKVRRAVVRCGVADTAMAPVSVAGTPVVGVRMVWLRGGAGVTARRAGRGAAGP